MKKLIPILTVILALFAGDLAAQENNDTKASTPEAKDEGAKEEGAKGAEHTNPVFD